MILDRSPAASPRPHPDPWTLCEHVPASPILMGCAEHRMPGRHDYLLRLAPCRAAEIMAVLVVGAHREAVATLRRLGLPTTEQEMRLHAAEQDREVLRLRHQVQDLEAMIDCLGTRQMRRRMMGLGRKGGQG